MTHDEMIAVIRAHKYGNRIECKRNDEDVQWKAVENPIWDFNRNDYRIAREPRKCWVNWAANGTPVAVPFNGLDEKNARETKWQLVTEQL